MLEALQFRDWQPILNAIDPAELAAYRRRIADHELARRLAASGAVVIRDRGCAERPRPHARVYHYRDNAGLEVDAIVDAGPGRWAAFEIKLGAGRIEEAAKALVTFAERVDTARCGNPAGLAVVTSAGYGYRRPDGVAAIPAGVLGP